MRPVGIVALLTAAKMASALSAQVPARVAIAHVTVIDVTYGEEVLDQTVIVVGNRIAAAGPSQWTIVPAGTMTVNGRGKFLIPGLWDMHVHLLSYAAGKRSAANLVMNGITGVRDMGTPVGDALHLRADVRAGTLLGPRMIIAGPLTEEPLRFGSPMILRVSDAAGARAAVDSLADRGADFIKVHDALSRDAYVAIADQANRRGIPFAGDVPIAVSAREAAAAGQHSIEHLGGRFYAVPLVCAGREGDLRATIDVIAARGMTDLRAGRAPDDSDLFRARITRPLADGFSPARERAFISLLLKNDSWQVPTLVAQPLRARLADAVPLSAEDRHYDQALLWVEARMVRDMVRAGVGVMSGSDLPLDRPALVQELKLMVDAGLTPAQALRTATINPARFLNATDSLGSVAQGKVADLVLLDGNPLKDIRATGQVSAVIVNGRLIDAEELQLMRDSAIAQPKP